MGVPGLAGNYYRKFKKQKELLINTSELTKLNAKHLFFDYNSLIHPCAHQILAKYTALDPNADIDTEKLESEIIENCLCYTISLVNVIQAETIWIVIDGIAPKSKIVQQRERRYKSKFLKQIESINSSCKWDSNKITPGTNFMKKLETALANLSINNLLGNKVQIEISSSNIPGEGEHKMMSIINNFTNTNINTNDSILIYGLDGDLLMISLVNKWSNNIILIRESAGKGREAPLDFVNIRNLKHYIYTDICNEFKAHFSATNEFELNNLLQDYLVITFLLGNDFLDKQNFLSIREYGIDIIIKAYVMAYSGKYLVNNGLINLNYLKDIFYNLKSFEEYYFSDKKIKKLTIIKGITQEQLQNCRQETTSNIYFYNGNDIALKKFTNIDIEPLTSNSMSSYCYKKKYYMYYNVDSVNNACFNYIQGLQWILGYYNGHVHQNWSWSYKYHTVPFCSDLFNYLQQNKPVFTFKKELAMSSLKQLCLVLPKESFECILKDFLPNNSIQLLLRSLPCFSEKLYIDLVNKDFLWQSKVFFKDYNEELIDTLLQLI